jgi:cytochrome b subunit of formate dehydrogenase
MTFSKLNVYPKKIRLAFYLGFLSLALAILDVLSGGIEARYAISNFFIYIVLFMSITGYFIGLYLIHLKKYWAIELLLISLLTNTWCIFPYLIDEDKVNLLPNFIFMSLLYLMLYLFIKKDIDVKRWMK